MFSDLMDVSNYQIYTYALALQIRISIPASYVTYTIIVHRIVFIVDLPLHWDKNNMHLRHYISEYSEALIPSKTSDILLQSFFSHTCQIHMP